MSFNSYQILDKNKSLSHFIFLYNIKWVTILVVIVVKRKNVPRSAVRRSVNVKVNTITSTAAPLVIKISVIVIMAVATVAVMVAVAEHPQKRGCTIKNTYHIIHDICILRTTF